MIFRVILPMESDRQKGKKGYGIQIARMLVEEARKMNIEEIILCHYESNKISPKMAFFVYQIQKDESIKMDIVKEKDGLKI